MGKRAPTYVKPIAQSYFGQVDHILETQLQVGRLSADLRKHLEHLLAGSFFAALPVQPTPVLAPLFVLGRTAHVLHLIPRERLQALELLLLTLSQVEGYSSECLEKTFLFESLCDPFGGKLFTLGIALAQEHGREHEVEQLQNRFDAYTRRLNTQTEHVFGTSLFYTSPRVAEAFLALFDEDHLSPPLTGKAKTASS